MANAVASITSTRELKEFKVKIAKENIHVQSQWSGKLMTKTDLKVGEKNLL